ncbi:MAG: CDP-diacylglycerol--glycerol-3-phosphate 3-phosphatidyltransferase [Fibrobacter sp.]|jgi:CDP-diacylglycerol--glycerol-3-phosphate 3-phosphatidyltransferase|uniref:CDP-diacylglycerol--glycerol-3-phosphate 3-phosphatidyltransferase n=1 Tax=uncultured Fibrobacter sp. TaxID=261512 RepID=UPI0015651EAC|nr:CDP-diacylglycerol--glycerol-3-phosphate 3-phosphatidyltransferase [uncultured Fibrobacter sp.]MBQ1823869.1 CDP-diacylglycerol--glycerol-3-phosphate 3-phosphatidyltransferase [Fibrobacter sp.]MBR6317650.1 CDP-diacylglycerol--glycerol-3-phosphate 3-phosphatidyltransferase [Fibrobacter sp.]
MTEKTSDVRFRSRIWSVLRAIVFICVIIFIWNGMSKTACAFVGIALVMGWVNLYQLRSQEIEKPYYRLWLNVIDGFLSFAVMTSIFIRDLMQNEQTEKLLAVGCVFLLARLIAHSLFSLGVLREGKSLPRKRRWSKLANIAITITMGVYLLNLEDYQQICMVTSILLIFASTVAYAYWYYRDPAHRKPLSIASQLTMSRIVLTPFFLWVFFYDNDLDYSNNSLVFKSLSLVMVLGFMLTDFLDGYLARKMGEVSTLGKYLDPFSDKISNMTIFMCFIATGYAPVWMVALIYFRESSVETLRTLAASEGLIMPARRSGKWKTALQGIGIVAILLGAIDPIRMLVPGLNDIWGIFPVIVMGVITAITIISGIDYFYSSKHILKKFV